jgi:dTDP-glucose pyrophosphorylase
MPEVSSRECNILIPMSGLGSRFANAGYGIPKPFIDVLCDSMIRSVIKNLNFDGANFIFIINESQVSLIDFSYHLAGLIKNFKVFTVIEVTNGPACSALIAKELIDNRTPLIIINCDQIIHDFDYQKIVEFSSINGLDGLLGCFISDSPKNSYVKLDSSGSVMEVKEKIVISNIATNGLHYWKFGMDFVSSAEAMIKAKETYNNEYYIAPTYNYLIKEGKKVLPFFYNMHYPIGTPEDLLKYQITFRDGDSQDRRF